MGTLTFIQKAAIWVLPVLFAITVHEYAHGWVAKRLGDLTAFQQGRLTLNPIKHIDPMGTILVPMLALIFSGYVFGWAKPVPVTWRNLRRPKSDMVLVALAGPVSNLLMGLCWALVFRLVVHYHQTLPWIVGPIVLMSIAGVFVNSIMLVLNLVPLPPLDGGRVLTGLLPGRWAVRVSRIEPYGILILIGLLLTGVLAKLIGPIIGFFFNAFALLAGLSVGSFARLLSMLISPAAG